MKRQHLSAVPGTKKPENKSIIQQLYNHEIIGTVLLTQQVKFNELEESGKGLWVSE